MGNKQSVRATHFQRPNSSATDDEALDEHHISISNKMVERLVEDATLTEVAEIVGSPKGDYKEKVFMEKLKCLDDSHSERCGLTVNDVNALMNRVETRTENIVGMEPVCVEYKNKIVECYSTNTTTQEVFKCWDAINAFTTCVQEAGITRLQKRTEREAEAEARRERDVARARHRTLREFAADGTA